MVVLGLQVVQIFFCLGSLLKLHLLRLLEGALPLVAAVSDQIIVVSHEVL